MLALAEREQERCLLSELVGCKVEVAVEGWSKPETGMSRSHSHLG